MKKNMCDTSVASLINVSDSALEPSWKLHALSIYIDYIVCGDACNLKRKSKRPKNPSNHSGQRRK